MQRGEVQQSVESLSRAVDLHAAIGDRYSQAGDCFYRADALLALGRRDEARADLEFALQVFTALGLPYADWVREKLQQL